MLVIYLILLTTFPKREEIFYYVQHQIFLTVDLFFSWVRFLTRNRGGPKTYRFPKLKFFEAESAYNSQNAFWPRNEEKLFGKKAAKLLGKKLDFCRGDDHQKLKFFYQFFCVHQIDIPHYPKQQNLLLPNLLLPLILLPKKAIIITEKDFPKMVNNVVIIVPTFVMKITEFSCSGGFFSDNFEFLTSRF